MELIRSTQLLPPSLPLLLCRFFSPSACLIFISNHSHPSLPPLHFFTLPPDSLPFTPIHYSVVVEEIVLHHLLPPISSAYCGQIGQICIVLPPHSTISILLPPSPRAHLFIVCLLQPVNFEASLCRSFIVSVPFSLSTSSPPPNLTDKNQEIFVHKSP